MAFPTIPTVAAGRVLSVLATNPAGTHTSPNLSSLTKNAGDLLIAIVIIYDGNSTNAEFSSWGGGFTEFADQAGTATHGIGCAYKWSTGSETGTFTVTSADTSANDSAFFLLSIPGAHASTPPEAGTMATGTSAAADPGSFNPSGWDAEDTLWIAVGASGETSTTGSYTGIASAPANYSDYADSGISADVVGGVEGAVAFRQLNAASEDVGTFSFDLTNARNAALTIAVRPAAASPTRGQVSFAELEVPFQSTRGRISFVEFETPLAPTRGRMSFAEFETPTVPTRGRTSWAELEAPAVPTRGLIAWVEFEVPDLAAGGGDITRPLLGRRRH